MKPLVIALLLVALTGALVAAAPYPEPPEYFASIEQEENAEENDPVRKKRQFNGGFNVNRTPFGKAYNANLGYNHVFNKGRTSVGVSGNKSWGALGKSHGFGVNFSHSFG